MVEIKACGKLNHKYMDDIPRVTALKFVLTPIPGLMVLMSEPFKDSRGLFERLYCKVELNDQGIYKEVVQINHSLTVQKGAIRGMHFQAPPFAETKIIRCLSGAVFDVAVDLRHGSPTFLNWHAEILTPDNLKMVFIPEGFAHGFQVLEPNSELLYFHSEIYNRNAEGGVRYDDPKINIQWPMPATDFSVRDQNFLYLDNQFKGICIY